MIAPIPQNGWHARQMRTYVAAAEGRRRPCGSLTSTSGAQVETKFGGRTTTRSVCVRVCACVHTTTRCVNCTVVFCWRSTTRLLYVKNLNHFQQNKMSDNECVGVRMRKWIVSGCACRAEYTPALFSDMYVCMTSVSLRLCECVCMSTHTP